MNASTKQSIVKAYRRHLRSPRRRAQTAIALKGCFHLYDSLLENEPKTVLECGSGMSTTIIRMWSAQRPDAVVYSTDHSYKWLGETVRELENEGLPTEHCLHFDVFKGIKCKPALFDWIFMDMADTTTRAKALPYVAGLLKRDGLLILDDWQFPHYRRRAEPILKKLGLEVVALPQTKDRFKRYVAEARYP